MAKNVVILSDGTGQGASMPKAERTNVWKLWDATKKADPAQQVTFYDEGLGAEQFSSIESAWRAYGTRAFSVALWKAWRHKTTPLEPGMPSARTVSQTPMKYGKGGLLPSIERLW